MSNYSFKKLENAVYYYILSENALYILTIALYNHFS